jgi:NADH:ubiquinone reductase (non-electrogenic)
LVSLQKVDNKLKELERRKFGKDSLIRVAVVGCGYSGVELAATVSERLQDRGLVQAINVNTTILPTAPPGNREAALKVRYLDFGSGKHVFFFKILLVQYLVTPLHAQRDMN